MKEVEHALEGIRAIEGLVDEAIDQSFKEGLFVVTMFGATNKDVHTLKEVVRNYIRANDLYKHLHGIYLDGGFYQFGEDDVMSEIRFAVAGIIGNRLKGDIALLLGDCSYSYNNIKSKHGHVVEVKI